MHCVGSAIIRRYSGSYADFCLTAFSPLVLLWSSFLAGSVNFSRSMVKLGVSLTVS